MRIAIKLYTDATTCIHTWVVENVDDCWPHLRREASVYNIYASYTSDFSSGTASSVLLEATVPIMSFYDCEQCMNDGQSKDSVLDGMMCAGRCGSNSQDTCQVTYTF